MNRLILSISTILTLMLSAIQSYGQTFDLDLHISQNYTQNKKMKDLDNFLSFGLKASYYPIDNIPLGISTSFFGGSLFSFGKEISRNNNQSEHIDIASTIYNLHIGLKLINQNSQSILTPYFAARTGLTRIGTSFILGSYTENVDESEYSIKNKERINRSIGLSYSLEGGIEIGIATKSKKWAEKNKVSISVSFVYLGSFNDLSYYNDKGASFGFKEIRNQNDYEEMKQSFKDNAILSSTRLSIYQISLGFNVRF